MAKKGKEVKIIPPEGYEIDREASSFECIKFKKKEPIWRDNVNNYVFGYYIDNSANIVEAISDFYQNIPRNRNIFATRKQAKSALAMARISQIMANDERFGGVVTEEEWKMRKTVKYIIDRCCSGIYCDTCLYNYHFLMFHTMEQRDLFLKENEDLVKDYLMVD